MAYLNKCMLIGNIGKDPQTAINNMGRKRVSFSLATSKRYRDNNGEQKELTTWHNVVLWGATAETFEKLGVKKGTALYVEGELTNRSWTDNNGQQRSMTEVNASTFQILTPRNGGAQQAPTYDYAKPPQQQTQASAPSDEDLDGLPF